LPRFPNRWPSARVAASAFSHAWHALEELVVRELILAGTRPDGRG